MNLQPLRDLIVLHQDIVQDVTTELELDEFDEDRVRTYEYETGRLQGLVEALELLETS